MKTAKWICNPTRPRRITGNPWGDRNYNNRSMTLPDEGGIVWFKRGQLPCSGVLKKVLTKPK